MDWVKIYERHLFGLTNNEIATLVKIQCLAARLEADPTEEEMLEVVSARSLNSLRDRFDKRSITLRHVLDKVSEDVQSVINSRSLSKLRKRKHDNKAKSKESNALPTPLRNATDKIREEKIISTESETIYTPSLPSDNLPAIDDEQYRMLSFIIDHWNYEISERTTRPEMKITTLDKPRIMSELLKLGTVKTFYDNIRKMCSNISSSDFFLHRMHSSCDVMWCFTKGYLKIMSGKYDGMKDYADMRKSSIEMALEAIRETQVQ